MKKLVSVIIPTFGGGEFLKRAINSVLLQTYNNIEIIVVDDNGIGTINQIKTATIIDEYHNDKIKYICHDVNKNGAAARNTGFSNSHGEYIALLDDDDEYTTKNIEEQVNILDSLPNEYALTYCSVETYLNGEKINTLFAKKQGYVLYDLLCHNINISSSSLMIRREIWKELGGFDESFQRHQDYEFTARVALKYKVMPVNNIGVHYILQFRNNPKSAQKAKEYRMHYLNKMQPLIKTLPKRKQKDVLIQNRLDVSLYYLKEHDIKGFIKEYIEIKPGYRGIVFLLKRLKMFLKRGGKLVK